MKTFEKTYIGKGKQIGNLRIVRVSLKIEDVLQHKHEYNGQDYITFEVAALQQPDKFGNTYTVYVSKPVENQVQEQAEEVKTAGAEGKKQAKTTKKAAKKHQADSDEIPF